MNLEEKVLIIKTKNGITTTKKGYQLLDTIYLDFLSEPS